MNIYWSVCSAAYNPIIDLEYNLIPFINFEDPESLFSKLTKMNLNISDKLGDFRYCPAFKKQVKNTFVLKSPIDYNLSFDREKDSVSSNMYDQDFFNKVVHVRSGIDAHCSLNIMYLFVSEESLSIQLTGAYFSDNDFVNKTMIIPGSFDIGKWCRPVECAFIAKKEFNEISINRGDDYSYIKFDTDKDLNFKKFIFSDKMKKMLAENSQSRSYNKKKFKPLEYWYDLFHNSKQKRIIMKEIKDNLI